MWDLKLHWQTRVEVSGATSPANKEHEEWKTTEGVRKLQQHFLYGDQRWHLTDVFWLVKSLDTADAGHKPKHISQMRLLVSTEMPN